MCYPYNFVCFGLGSLDKNLTNITYPKKKKKSNIIIGGSTVQLINLDMGHIYAHENITLKAYMHSSLITFFPRKTV